MNIEKFKGISLEEYKRNIQNVIYKIKELEKNELFIRLINYDRQLLYASCEKVIYSSHNNGELGFFESITHFISYYIFDDGELTIRYHKYDMKEGKMITAEEGHKRSIPYLDFAKDYDKLAGEKEVMWVLDWHENHQEEYKQQLIDAGMYDGSFDEKEFIDYN